MNYSEMPLIRPQLGHKVVAFTRSSKKNNKNNPGFTYGLKEYGRNSEVVIRWGSNVVGVDNLQAHYP